jgi:hypothetical protein
MTPEEFRDMSLRILALYQESFRRGNKSALLEVVYFCACFGDPLPKWAMVAFDAAQNRARFGEIESWDEVFGKPWGEGRRKARWTQARGTQIWFTVMALRLNEMKIEDAFAKVAAEKNMTVPTVRRLHYEVDRLCKKLGFSPVSQIGNHFDKR